MLSCEILELRLEDDIHIKINNWFLLNKEKKVRREQNERFRLNHGSKTKMK